MFVADDNNSLEMADEEMTTRISSGIDPYLLHLVEE